MPQDNTKAGRRQEPPPPVPSSPQGVNYLVVIGIDTYAHCPRLYNCVKDANDLITLLTERYRFESEHIRTLFNKNATRANIYQAFRSIAECVMPYDNLIIYFSGHGEYDPVFKRGYWIPVDAQQNNYDQYISNSDVKDFLAAINSHHTFLMADSCFAGSLFAKGMAKNIEKRYEKDPSLWGLTAGRNEIVSDGKPGDNSPFAESILYRLKQNTGSLGVQELCAYVTEYVQAKTNQTPIGEPLKVEGHKNGQFVFHLKKDERRDWAAAQQENTIAAYERFLLAYPDGMHTNDAKSVIALLREEIAWQEAQRRHTIPDYETYLAAFPKGRYRRQAIDAQRNIEEIEAWERATRRNTIPAYREFQDNHPNSTHDAEATARIQKILNRDQFITKPGREKKPINLKPYLVDKSNSGFSRRSIHSIIGIILIMTVLFFGVWKLIPKNKITDKKDTEIPQDSSNITEIIKPIIPDTTEATTPAPVQPTKQPDSKPTQNTTTITTQPGATTPSKPQKEKPPVNIDPAALMQHLRDARAYLRAGLQEEAAISLRRALNLDRNNAAAKDALQLMQFNDLAGAISVLDKALQ